MKQLTQQQKRFVAEYIKTLDGELSAKNAGYKSPDLKAVSNNLLSNNFVIKEIKEQLKNQISSLRVQKGYVIQKLLQIAEFSLEEEEITDKEGNYTDTNVQINDVDPRNASYLEMLAYTTYSDVEGFTKNAFGDFMNAAGGVNGNITYDSDSINEKKDYMSMIKEFMQLQYDSNNLSGYLSYKELYDYINDRTER